MKMKVLAAAFLLGSSGFALAADPGMPMEEAPLTYNWSGFYVGIKGGYGWGSGDYTNEIGPGFELTSDHDLDGFLVGVYAGAQHQFSNNIVLGVEIDVDYRDADDSSTYIVNPGGIDLFGGAFGLDTEINWTGSARLRAGYAMDRWLPYITGGFAFADYDSVVTAAGVPFPAIPGIATSFGGTSVGWTAGIGTEYAFTDNMTLRAEYRYSDFGDITPNLVIPMPGANQSYDLDSHDLTLGISWKF